MKKIDQKSRYDMIEKQIRLGWSYGEVQIYGEPDLQGRLGSNLHYMVAMMRADECLLKMMRS